MIWLEDCGWWLPDGEEHLQQWMRTVNCRIAGRLTYQHNKLTAALDWCTRRKVAVDVGAHVGLWSWPLAHRFDQVIAFEPVEEHRACWRANVSAPNARLEAFALGAEAGRVMLRRRTPGSSGDTGVDAAAERSSLRQTIGAEGSHEAWADMRTLDSFDLEQVDFVKLDCEGYEMFVVEGARDTLARCRPCVIIEQKPKTGMAERYGIGVTDGVKRLESMGAKLRGEIKGDYILSWD